ncbi:MAG TPA: diguanylate cyclase [Candidatus Saccharimonadales bacterium]|nr:diguanylate cyclase [Candidatus Saccharimonadales bacterium]
MSSGEANRFEVPEIFRGEVPASFYYDVIKKYGSPQQRVAGYLNRILFKRPPEKIISDNLVRSMYALAISRRAEAQARRDYEQDRFDDVTGLLNRKHAKIYGDAMLGEAGGKRKSAVIGFLVDVVGFGDDINNIYGHPHGDDVLRDDVGAFLQSTVRADKGDVVSRWGGDEYLILVDASDPSISPQALARKVGQRLINIPYTEKTQPRQIRFRAAIGGAGMKTQGLYAKADLKGEKNKELAVYSRINPSYFSGQLSN